MEKVERKIIKLEVEVKVEKTKRIRKIIIHQKKMKKRIKRISKLIKKAKLEVDFLTVKKIKIEIFRTRKN